jgi:chorismate synthase
MSNTLGEKLKVTIFGQSHAPAIGAVIDGLPAGMRIDWQRVQAFMGRRAPGRGDLTTARREDDVPRVIAGLNERGETCGAPLCAVIDNGDARSADYDALRDRPRPGHADYTAYVKFGGANDIRGGGQFSGRMTAPLCFAGAVCLQWLEGRGVAVGARIASVGMVDDAPVDHGKLDAEQLRAWTESAFPTADALAGESMRDAIREAKASGDSLGGVIEACAVGLPPGLGEPMFGGVENRVAAAVFGIPGVRGVEFGAGFAAARMTGSAHNDAWVVRPGDVIGTETNRHGGVLGGITTGMPLVVRAAFKPTPSIGKAQKTVSLSEKTEQTLSITGRHDPCIVPRAVPCVEAALAIVLTDMLLSASL